MQTARSTPRHLSTTSSASPAEIAKNSPPAAAQLLVHARAAADVEGISTGSRPISRSVTAAAQLERSARSAKADDDSLARSTASRVTVSDRTGLLEVRAVAEATAWTTSRRATPNGAPPQAAARSGLTAPAGSKTATRGPAPNRAAAGCRHHRSLNAVLVTLSAIARAAGLRPHLEVAGRYFFKIASDCRTSSRFSCWSADLRLDRLIQARRAMRDRCPFPILPPAADRARRLFADVVSLALLFFCWKCWTLLARLGDGITTSSHGPALSIPYA